LKALRMVCGFSLGLILGAGAVLLFAPRSGPETQGVIRQRIQEILSEGRRAAEIRRLELSAQFEALKQSQPRA